MSDLAALARRTRDVYARSGLRYDEERSRTLFERPWRDRFLALLPDRPAVLDACCGAGEPVYHASLSPTDYETRLGELGMRVVRFVAEDPACDHASVLLAREGAARS